MLLSLSCCCCCCCSSCPRTEDAALAAAIAAISGPLDELRAAVTSIGLLDSEEEEEEETDKGFCGEKEEGGDDEMERRRIELFREGEGEDGAEEDDTDNGETWRDDTREELTDCGDVGVNGTIG